MRKRRQSQRNTEGRAARPPGRPAAAQNAYCSEEPAGHGSQAHRASHGGDSERWRTAGVEQHLAQLLKYRVLVAGLPAVGVKRLDEPSSRRPEARPVIMTEVTWMVSAVPVRVAPPAYRKRADERSRTGASA